MPDKINKTIDKLINSKSLLDDIVDALKALKKDGVSKNMIIKCLTAARKSGLSETQDNTILEALDIAHGFCQERHRVW